MKIRGGTKLRIVRIDKKSGDLICRQLNPLEFVLEKLRTFCLLSKKS